MEDPAPAGVKAAPIVLRRDRDIYATDGGWFQARWHFSFDHYHDPDNMGVGTLRVFNHDTLVAGAVWPMHPHRDVEGITYVVAGHFEHADSLDNDGVLERGGVQRMTLGSGAWHSERNHSKTEPVQFIQMWILPDRRGLPPGVEQKQFTLEDRQDRLLQILKPEGADGPGVTVHEEVWMYASRLEAAAAVEHEFGEGRGGYFYLIEGALRLNGERLTTGDAAKITGAGLLRLETEVPSELLLVDTPL
ncbi:MAG: pirin family protein [Chloroflexi bacterium]|nr:pirin family protein [Chloroflexota bacterium]